MGLVYMMPISEDEGDRVEIKDKKITLKSYGLPMVFWGYLAAIFIVVFAMHLGIKDPLQKLYETGDTLNMAMVSAVGLLIYGGPLVVLGYYFYEKRIIKQGNKIVLAHHLFFIRFISKTMTLKDEEDNLYVRHYIDSPNMAKMQNDPDMRGFENKGYFELRAKVVGVKKDVLIDRSSRKQDLIKLKNLLDKF